MAEEKSQRAPAASEDGRNIKRSKSIILFSDGTGNSSGKLFKTNVWRMYEAVDLGPTPRRRNQISYYDDGVGTSGFKPLAMLGGAFGWGLKRNVLDIYRYACRNYRPADGQEPGRDPKANEGDHVYGFGFSRGAFTMRLAIALIASQGLVVSDDESDLLRKTEDAYRAFRTPFLPRKWTLPTRIFRKVRDAISGFIRRRRGIAPYDPGRNYRPVIRFVGVWDTVAAYGGPLAELTRAIDNWIFALSMAGYGLDKRVGCARHALALDDERDAFHPLLWDEVNEKKLVDEKEVEEGRLEQVWFTGMHADVGGGYPDESLSYVSLLWMMEEAESKGLRTLKVIKDRYRALANSYGPMHDSRAGAGSYYRYQPRKISAWLHPVDKTTLSLRDPIITGADGKPQGLLYAAKIHESVIARIVTGTDRYAPITLPDRIRIVPPQKEGENVPQADSEAPAPTPRSAPARAMIAVDRRIRLEDQDASKARARAMEAVWNRVWRRRLTYFVTVAFTIALVSMPAWIEKMPSPPLLADGRTWIGGIIRLLTFVLPGFAGGWVDTYADNAFYFLVLVATIMVLLATSKGMERRLRDRARAIWDKSAAIDGPLPRAPKIPRVQRFRNSETYQRAVQLFKWTVLPNFVFWPLMLAFALWGSLGLYTQARLPSLETGGAFCPKSDGPLPPLTATRFEFTPRSLCHGLRARVVADQRYIVTFDVIEEWRDGELATTPIGLAASDVPRLLGYLGVPFRRVIDANYLQPVVEIRPARSTWSLFENVHIEPLTLTQQGDSSTRYRGEFTARRSGELALFANDSVLPFTSPRMAPYDIRYFYERTGSGRHRGNSGTACVTIVSSNMIHSNRSSRRIFPVATSGACGEADLRAAIAAEQRRASRGRRGRAGR